MFYFTCNQQNPAPWNKGKLVGQKPPLKRKEVWSIRIRLQLGNRTRDVAHGTQVAKRAMVMQRKTLQPVQFEITPQTREAISEWIESAPLKSCPRPPRCSERQDDQKRISSAT